MQVPEYPPSAICWATGRARLLVARLGEGVTKRWPSDPESGWKARNETHTRYHTLPYIQTTCPEKNFCRMQLSSEETWAVLLDAEVTVSWVLEEGLCAGQILPARF